MLPLVRWPRWLRPRSGGVSIDRQTHALIAAADRARDLGAWDAAARAYGAALKRRGDLAHIRMQFGHALKEVGQPEQARQAYVPLCERPEIAAEAWLHLGHLAKRQGDDREAATCYLAAFARAPNGVDQFREWLWTIRNVALDPSEIAASAALIGAGRPSPGQIGVWPAACGPGGNALLFDITDLITFASHSRLPSGIQRVQIELVTHALRDRPNDTGAACFLRSRGGWVVLDADKLFELMADMQALDRVSDHAWRQRIGRLMVELASRDPVAPSAGAVLCSVSPSWSDPDYLEHVAELKRRCGVKFVPFVYDVIPILEPSFFDPPIPHQFRIWLEALVPLADTILAISRATAADLRDLARHDLPPVEPHRIRILPLDADVIQRAGAPAAARTDDEPPFVLMVSTIEPRKDHLTAFRTWLDLRRHLGREEVPRLICVGGRGWRNRAVYDMLAADQWLRDRVELRHGVTDACLAGLYRECIGTFYPSRYEGWGLPVTESLCHGRVPIVSRAGAMPEAGSTFALYADPGDHATFASHVMTLLDPARRAILEHHISDDFKPRSWTAIARSLRVETDHLSAAALPG